MTKTLTQVEIDGEEIPVEVWEKRDLTIPGILNALFDILFAGIYLVAALTIARNLYQINDSWMLWPFSTLMLFFATAFIRNFTRVTRPRDNYEVHYSMPEKVGEQNDMKEEVKNV